MESIANLTSPLAGSFKPLGTSSLKVTVRTRSHHTACYGAEPLQLRPERARPVVLDHHTDRPFAD